MRAVSLIASLAVLAACGDDASTTSDAPATVDAAVDAAGGLPTTCTGACVTTALTANFGATVRVLDRAYYGVNLDGTLHVEAYRGGGSGCPTMTSPTPAYTLVLGGVPVPTSTAAATSP
ncbi:MAG: hypothetical protein NT062_23215, partial [Proteobacteria bacterium]|nr:hypothetical protein [Pseudomonadota bacterium]